MKKTIGIFLAVVVAWLNAMADDTADVSATVSVSTLGFCADGSSVDGQFELGYAATESQNAVLKINDERLMNITSSGHWPWSAPTAGVYTVSHTVGDEVLSATYVVTNGYAKVSEEPNPPMDEVDGITLSTTNVSVAATKKTTIVKITGSAEWTAVAANDWLTLNAASGTGAKNLAVFTAENVAAESRVGYVYVAGQIGTVTQAGRGATLDRTNVSAATDGSEETIAVTTEDAAATWEAWTACPWILVETSQGTGSGEVVLKLAPWNIAASRAGTVTIAGQTVTVTQSGSQVVLSERTSTASVYGGVVAVDVTVPNGVAWAVADVPEWIALEGAAERTGAEIVKMSVATNETFEARSATVRIAGQEFVVTQDAAKIEVEGGLTRICPVEGADLTITVRVDVASASWSVAISEDAADDWVFMKSGDETLTGDAMFDLYVAEADDGTTLPRTAIVTIGNQTLVITQKPAGVVVTPTDGGVAIEIPDEWFEKYYPTANASERQAIAEGAGVKTDASGAAMPVWQDYVAGTDPTNALSKFTAKIEMKDGAPVVTWSPALNGDGVREGTRVYRVWGKADLGDAAWSEVEAGGEGNYRFFRVTVEMP